MLGWLKQVANNPPIVLMIRHPLQVTSSWLKLGWGKEAFGKRSDLDIIMSQEALLNDYPVISDAMKRIDTQDPVERIVFQWCIYHFIPSNQLKNNEAYPLFYEALLTEAENESVRLFHYLNKPFNQKMVHNIMEESSNTNFLERDFNKNQSQLLNSWKDIFSARQIQRADSILASFGLDNLYDKNGYPTGSHLLRD